MHYLYAMPHSLYSGRARAYLIKNHISFEERSTGHDSFKRDVLPKGKLPRSKSSLARAGYAGKARQRCEAPPQQGSSFTC